MPQSLRRERRRRRYRHFQVPLVLAISSRHPGRPMSPPTRLSHHYAQLYLAIAQPVRDRRLQRLPRQRSSVPKGETARVLGTPWAVRRCFASSGLS